MSKAARLLALCLLAFGMAYSHAANFSKNTSSYLQVQGNTAKYTLSPQNTGSLQFPNTGWQVVGNALASGLTIGKTQNLPVPAGAALPVTAKVIVSPNSLAKSLVNPWGFVASMALQQTLGYLADQACVRIAGGQMTNTGGLWEECIIREETQAFFRVNQDDRTVTNSMQSSCSQWASLQGVYISTPVTVVGDWSGIPSTASANWSFDNMPSCLFYYQETFNGTPIGSEYPRTARLQIKLASGEKKEWNQTDSLNAASKIESAIIANPNLQPSIFNDLYESGSVFDVQEPVLSGPASVNVGQPVTMTKTNPDGSTETSTQQFVRNYSYAGDTVTHVSTTTVNVTNNAGNTTTTTIITPNDSLAAEPQEVKLETCGLPGKPACKIDETGTPTVSADPEITAFDQIKICLQNPVSCLPAFPELSWAFTVPTSCTAIPLSGFGEYISEIDICPFQSMFHDLMSMIWLAAGLFGASAMLFRDSQGA